MPVAYRCRRCQGPALPHSPGTQRGESSACPHCHGFYSYERIFVGDGEVEGAELASLREGGVVSAHDLMEIVKSDPKAKRRPTGLAGIDWIFGGGLPTSGAVFLCARAGCGKSTLLMTIFRALARRRVATLYVNAEQSLQDLGRQFAWLGRMPAKHMGLLAETDADAIFEAIDRSRVRVAAIDSIHTIENVEDPNGAPLVTGASAAVAQLARDIKRRTSDRELLVFVVGHVNNDGTIAGGTRVQHMLDATLVLQGGAYEDDPARILRFEGKNRFGPMGRRARLEMREGKGLVDLGPHKEPKAELPTLTEAP